MTRSSQAAHEPGWRGCKPEPQRWNASSAITPQRGEHMSFAGASEAWSPRNRESDSGDIFAKWWADSIPAHRKPRRRHCQRTSQLEEHFRNSCHPRTRLGLKDGIILTGSQGAGLPGWSDSRPKTGSAPQLVREKIEQKTRRRTHSYGRRGSAGGSCFGPSQNGHLSRDGCPVRNSANSRSSTRQRR